MNRQNRNYVDKSRAKHKQQKGDEGAITSNLVVLPGVGLPARMRLRVRAVSSHAYPISTSIVSHAIGCNTPLLPFKTATTTNVPAYIDWLHNAYEDIYTVRAHIRVELLNVTVADSVFAVLSFDSDTTVATDISALAEQRGSRSNTLGYFSAGSNKTVMTSVFTPEVNLGIPYNSVDNKVNTTDPADPYYWIVSVKSAGGGSGNIAYRIIVDYDIEFDQLIAPTP